MWKSITAFCVFLSYAVPTYAQPSITPAQDATGTQVIPNGTQYQITGGTQAGSNLFHSFQQLGLNPGEVANFIAQPHIQNILGRVVGGEASLINGLIQVAGGNANLYLMNPAGIIFGPNAQLNVPADFTATTATAIGFGNNTWFNAQGENNYANLIGIPSEFQFPYTNPGTIINEGNLTVNPQQHLTLLGGTTINLGTLEAPGGKITIAAIPGEQVVRISQEGHLLTLDLPLSETPTTPETPIQPPSLPQLITGGFLSHANQMTVNSQGQVELTGSGITLPPSSGLNITSGTLDVSGNQGGEMQILGQQIGVIDANINASGINGGGEIFVGGDIQGQGILPNASRTFISPNSQLSADALEAGDGGQIIIFAEETARIYGTLSARGGQHSGNGGFIETSGLQSLDLTQTPDTSAPFGEGGTWLIDPYNVEIVAGNGNTNINTSAPFTPTGSTAQLGVDLITTALSNSSNVEITTVGTGGLENGDITLSTDLDFNSIGTSTLTLNAAGNIDIQGQIFDSNTSSGGDRLNLNFTASDGSVYINQPISTQSGSITLTGISNITLDSGILINAPVNSGGGTINLDGTSLAGGNGINLQGTLDSQGGNITLNAATIGGFISLNSTASISAGTGDIQIITDSPYITQPISGTGNLTLQPQSPGLDIEIGGDNFGYLTFLNHDEINLFQDGFNSITLESPAGNLDVLPITGFGITANFKDPVILNAAGDLRVQGLIETNGNPLNFDIGGLFTLSQNQLITGNLDITASDINMDCCQINSSSGSNINLRPQNPNATIFLGQDIPGQFSLNEVEMSQNIDTTGTVTIENTGTISIAALDLNNSGNPAPPRQYTLVLKGETLEFFNALTLSPNQTGEFIATGSILDSSPVNSAIFGGRVLLDANAIGTETDPLYIKGSQLAAITRSGNLFLDTGDILINPPQNTVSTVSGITGIQSAGQLNIQGSQLLNLDDNLTSNGAMTLAPPLNLVDDITLDSNGGFINLDNTINGNQTLILNSGGATFTSPVGNTTPLNNLTVTGATQLNANITTTDTQTYNNAVQLNDNLTLNSTNNITFGQTLDGAQDLTLNSDSITFSDAVGSVDPLNRLNVNGNTRLNNNITTTTDQTYTGSVQLDNSVILESGNGNISFANTVDGAHTLTVNSDNITFADAVGSIDPLNQLTVNGTTALNGDITTTGGQTYNGFVQLNNSVTLDSGGANIAFSNPISGTEDLTVNAGEIIFSDAVGSPNPLTGLTVNGNTTLNGNVTTTGGQTYNGSVQVNDNLILESGNGDITFGQTLDGTQDFKVDAGTGNITFNGKVGSTNPLANFTIDSTGLTQINDTVNAGQIRTNAGGTTEINADITTTGEQSYNDAVILGSSVTFTTNNGNLTFDNTVDGTTAGGENLTVQTGTGDLQFFGAVGNSVPLGDITLVADDMSFEGSLAGTGNLTIEPFTNSQNIRLGGIDNNDSNTLEISSEDIQNWQNGFQAIAIGRNTLSGTVVTEGSLTFQDPVTVLTGSSLTVNGTLTGNDNASITLNAAQINLNADITTANNDINLNGAINLGADALLSTGTGEGNLNIGGTIDGNAGLTLESGTGEISLNGNLGETNPLNRLNIQGQVTTGGNGLSITTINDVTTGDISTSGQPLSLTSNQGNIQTGDLDTSATGSGGSLTLTSPTGSITTGNLTSAGDTAGGDINVQAQVSITTGDIDSSATTGDGGSVFLDPIGNVQVGFINAQGGTAGTGGNVFAESTGAFFQARGTFIDQNGQNASISTAGGLGGGTIEIRHQGGTLNAPIQPFVVGNGGVNGTQGVITTGAFTLSNQEFADSFTLGTIQIVTDDGLTPTTVTPINTALTSPIEEPTVETNVPITIPVTPPVPTAPVAIPLIPTESPSISEFPTSAPSNSGGGSGNGSGSGNGGAVPVVPSVFPGVGVPISGEGSSDNGVGSAVNAVLLGREHGAQPLLLSADEVNLDETIAALEAQFTREYEVYLGLENNTRILQLREIQSWLEEASQAPVKTGLIYVVFGRRQLEENAALVCPVPTAVEVEGVEPPPACLPHPEDALHLILVTANEEPIQVDFPQVKREEVMALVNELRQEVTNQFKLRTTSYLPPAQALHELLIEPLEGTLEEQGIETLVMIPDAGLRSLPIAVLHDGEQFLMEKYSLGLIPSFSLTLPEYRNLQGVEVLAMGASEFEEMPPLPAVPVELREIGGEDAFLNEGFTVENLRTEHQTGEFPIIHLATHADFQEGAPDNSFIQLWESQIQLPEMRGLEWGNPPVDLLTLSACRTALGSQEAELGFAGLAVMSGAKSALASLWYSSDVGTLALMSKFYDQLESAPTRAEALRRAQLAMLEGEVSLDGGQLRGTRGEGGIPLPKNLDQGSVSFSHPYYWGAFTMIGTPW
ncbi:CHAT domain-containing protein [Roseofilum capinflatum]|uniref:CHAT domain-containing protein n=1 Tax=Roseofilum capinflatum BLCC-M114 TaxID=3022440 RepID=A0ABT7B5N4_9CYAN|nr:CHAT domain-containing protein [Roseofilum capinflatum]MDJ1174474.1 CHAT domain-containing protein [Roseofilum capinflatum BLCC-M114]